MMAQGRIPRMGMSASSIGNPASGIARKISSSMEENKVSIML